MRRGRVLALTLGVAASTGAALGASDAAGALAVHRFHSAPSLQVPNVSFSGMDPDPGAGDVFVDAQNWIQAGPMILSPQGQLIWFDPLPNQGVARNLQVQAYQGQTVLTYWEAHGNVFGVGRDIVLNHSYQPIAVVKAGNGFIAGTHDFQITPQGTALLVAYKNVPADLSAVGGPRQGTLVDAAVQEVNIATGQVLWQWDAHDHVSVSNSYAGKPGRGRYDAYHMNSVQQLPDGNVLISIRNTFAIYEINKRTGQIIWSLGGRHSSFTIGPGANFEWQHDARMLPDGTITVFDDGAALTNHGLFRDERESRALRIRLDFKTHRATLVRAYTANPPLLAESEGSMQVLPDGNVFVGWGSAPYFTELSPAGHQLFSMHFPEPLQSYRAYRFPWSGQPAAPPSISVAATARGTTVYASWNGATDVASWRVLIGPSGTAAFTPIGQFAKSSFETTMPASSLGPYFEVEAISSSGGVLATSVAVPR